MKTVVSSFAVSSILLAACSSGPIDEGSAVDPATSSGFNVVFPAGSGVVDVTQAPFGAIPSDGVDDTAAIQAALNANPSGNTIFYFPDGVYNISNTLAPALDDGVTKRNIFQGQTQNGTVLKLADNLNFGGAVIDFGGGAAQHFRNAVRNLTIDIGTGNPNAVGLDFNANNQGTVKFVTIRSGDGSGRIGLDLRNDQNGPLLVQHVTVEGFDVGIHTAFNRGSQTFEDISLKHQNVNGWVNENSQSVFARRVHSINEVRAIRNDRFNAQGDGQGRFLLIDSTLEGTGAAANVEAIRNQKVMYVRNVSTPGYQRALLNVISANQGNGTIDGDFIEEYWANGAHTDRQRGGVFELFDSPDTMLNLPIKETPQVGWGELDDWVAPVNNPGDDTAAIQAAIDSGATTVYLPNGTWQIDGVVELRGNVERLIGTEARLVTDDDGGVIRLVDGSRPVVVVERLEFFSSDRGNPLHTIRFEHACNRTWVFNNLAIFDYEPTIAAPGDVFINDVVGKPAIFRNQNVWARQLNLEGDIPDGEAKLLNDGGTVWILGYKNEDDGTAIKTINGGKTELLGGLQVGRTESGTRFVTEESSFSAALALQSIAGSGFDLAASETRGGVTRTTTGFGSADVYVAFSADLIADREVQVDASDATGASLVGAWTSSTESPGGFIGADFLFTNAGSGASVSLTPDLLVNGDYEVFSRWPAPRSGTAHSNPHHAFDVPFTVNHALGSERILVNQRVDAGRWVSLGTFTFRAGTNGSVTIGTDGARGGKVIADSVRFVLRSGTDIFD